METLILSREIFVTLPLHCVYVESTDPDKLIPTILYFGEHVRGHQVDRFLCLVQHKGYVVDWPTIFEAFSDVLYLAIPGVHQMLVPLNTLGELKAMKVEVLS